MKKEQKLKLRTMLGVRVNCFVRSYFSNFEKIFYVFYRSTPHVFFRIKITGCAMIARIMIIFLVVLFVFIALEFFPTTVKSNFINPAKIFNKIQSRSFVLLFGGNQDIAGTIFKPINILSIIEKGDFIFKGGTEHIRSFRKSLLSKYFNRNEVRNISSDNDKDKFFDIIFEKIKYQFSYTDKVSFDHGFRVGAIAMIVSMCDRAINFLVKTYLHT